LTGNVIVDRNTECGKGAVEFPARIRKVAGILHGIEGGSDIALAVGEEHPDDAETDDRDDCEDENACANRKSRDPAQRIHGKLRQLHYGPRSYKRATGRILLVESAASLETAAS